MLICTYKLSDEFVELLCHPLEGINITYRLFWLLVVYINRGAYIVEYAYHLSVRLALRGLHYLIATLSMSRS